MFQGPEVVTSASQQGGRGGGAQTGVFAGNGALLIGSLLAVLVLAYYFTSISRVLLFWVAFVLTRPFGATFGDLLTKSTEKHGLGFGTQGSSLILFGLLVGLVLYETFRTKQPDGVTDARASL